MNIKKKIWSEHFEEILKGNKTFEVRLDNFELKVGDTLILEEWDPDKKEYTGRSLEKKVSNIFKTKDITFYTKEDIEKHGLKIISLK